MNRRDIDAVVSRLEAGWGGTVNRGAAPELVALYHQLPLDAIDRHELDRFHLWPTRDPRGALFSVAAGTVMPLGEPDAGAPLADTAERLGWRVLLGSPQMSDALLESAPRGLMRRRVVARDQRVMAVTASLLAPVDGLVVPAGFRPARRDDVDLLAEFACRLHVEDQMGPSVARSSRAAIWGRMLDSVLRGATWVVERGGRPVAKLDLSLRTATRGAQIAGVYVEPEWRGRGIAAGAVHHLTRQLLSQGLPGVTLHVRADNTTAQRAYVRAGLIDIGAYRLALR